MDEQSGEYKLTRNIVIGTFIAVVVLLIGLVLFIAIPDCVNTATNVPALSFASSRSVNITDTTIIDSLKKMIISNEMKTVKIDTGTVKAAAACKTCIKDRLDTGFPYFMLLLGVLVLLTLIPRIKNFKITKDGVEGELFELAKAFNEAQNQNAQNPQLPQGGKTTKEEHIKSFTAEKAKMAEQPGTLDPQKGKWGGSATNNNRELSATITPIIGSEWVDITLKVKSTVKEDVLKGFVVFHLHPTFTNPNPVIIVLNGVAELKIKAWGAFTVGAVADKGDTTLELDLENDPGSFEPFKSR